MAVTSAGRVRQTQAERRAISRDKVINAAIKCLVTVGYAATSTNLIAATADMSVGRMQHQFSTKAEIMAAVIEFIHDENSSFLSVSKLKAETPEARIGEYIHRLRQAFERDSVLASLEIRFAMKGDKDLTAAVEPRFQAYDTRSFGELEELLTAANIERDVAHVWMRLMIATIRGLAMERVANYRISNRIDAERSLTMLTDLLLNRDRPAPSRPAE